MLLTIKNIMLQLLFAGFSFAVTFEKTSYFTPERAKVWYYDTIYVTDAHWSAKRNSRKDPNYYINFTCYTHVYIANNFTFHFYFYEFLTNTYQRSFVEAHIKGCNMIYKNHIFGEALKYIMLQTHHKSCPFPPGLYAAENVTMPFIHHFPFKKGRLYVNVTFDPLNIPVMQASLDFEVKEKVRRKN